MAYTPFVSGRQWTDVNDDHHFFSSVDEDHLFIMIFLLVFYSSLQRKPKKFVETRLNIFRVSKRSHVSFHGTDGKYWNGEAAPLGPLDTLLM